MENFRFYVPTDIRFGKGRLNEELPVVLNRFGKNILLVYGGGSIKKIGLYQQVLTLLEQSNHLVIELGGIAPNPRIESVRKGIDLCRQHQIDVILAVGGGSTIDCAKVIAAGYYYKKDAWSFVLNEKGYDGSALPVVTILTLAATGSEMNAGAVITNEATNQKLGVGGPSMLPKVSFLDPRNTFTVSKIQTAAGSADILSHLIENYFKKTKKADVQDDVSEGLMKTVIKNCPIALMVERDYDARANLMWASSLALSGMTGNGKTGSWSCHPMEHELSAFYDITHGVGLAILTPRWMKYILSDETVGKFVKFSKNVWGIVGDDPYEVAKEGIQALYDYFLSCGLPMALSEVGIGKEKFSEMADRAVAHSSIAEEAYVPLNATDIVNIYEDCLITNWFV